MARTYAGEWVISSLLDDRADRLTDTLFVSSESGELTYGQLRDRAQRFAGALQQLGVTSGDRVATMLDSSIEYVSCWFGIVWAGAVDVPINTEFKGTFLEHVLRDSAANVLVIDRRWLELAGLELPDLRHVVMVGEPRAAGELTVHGIAEMLAADTVARVPRKPRDLVYIMYTSGTTGPGTVDLTLRSQQHPPLAAAIVARNGTCHRARGVRALPGAARASRRRPDDRHQLQSPFL